jgi:hypothetical protein
MGVAQREGIRVAKIGSALAWTDLERRRKGDEEKVRIADGLRGESIMTLKWMARRLRMGSWTYVSNCL